MIQDFSLKKQHLSKSFQEVEYYEMVVFEK